MNPASHAEGEQEEQHDDGVPFWVDALGWLGTVLVLGAHALANTDVVDDTGGIYAALNAVGSAALLVMCVRRGVWPAVCLNVVWGAVAVVKLVSLAM